MTVHAFAPYLARANSERDRAFWEAVFRRWFGKDLRDLAWLPDDAASQRVGVDVVVVLSGARVLKLDTKLREKAYPDILLEHTADEERGTPGWIVKPTDATHFAYAYRPTSEGYLLPVKRAQDAWALRGAAWRQRWPDVPADNEGGGRKWRTLSCPVPRQVLLFAMAGVAHAGPERAS